MKKRILGIFISYGWKKNLLTIAVSFLICILLGMFTSATSNVRGISAFDLGSAITPFFGLVMGIWFSIGYLLYCIYLTIHAFAFEGASEFLHLTDYILILVPSVIYSLLPYILWYAIPVKGEKETAFPRLDTSAHVIKFYLVIVASSAGYMAVSLLSSFRELMTGNLPLRYAYWSLQYLDVLLLIGIPLLIIVSLVRNRTLTINERMVLSFLIVGVIASAMGAYFVYRNTLHLDPSLFEDYELLMRTDTDAVTDEMFAAFDRYNAYWDQFYVMTAIMLNAILIIEMFFMCSIERKVTQPVIHLGEVLERYAQPGSADTDSPEASWNPATAQPGLEDEAGPGQLDPQAVRESCRPYRYGYGEISSLTRTCVDMVGRIDTYTNNLRQITAEKERIGAELNVASKIQQDMLPSVFPPFPERSEFDLFASMKPAKEVGGDFYDFYFIDQDHLALTIADVSGKGIPASLFMVISKTLLKNQAQTGSSPKETLTYVNHQLCQNNETMMFCTVWLGILDLTTGTLTASNGGHEYPAFRKKDGRYELVRQIHDPAMGVIDGIRYREYEMTLEPGDSLFVYTDGVPEATDASQELLGEERMIEALNIEPDAMPQRQIQRVHETIHAFVQDEPQFDDITMLCLKFKGKSCAPSTHQLELTVPARIDSLGNITEQITQQLEAVDCPEDMLFAITLAVEEIFVNIANYAYEGGEGEARITYSFDPQIRRVEIVFTDSGLPFDPTARPPVDISLGAGERQIGGLGIHIVKKAMDDVIYKYAGGKNILTIRKSI